MKAVISTKLEKPIGKPRRSSSPIARARGGFFLSGEVRIEFLQDFLAGLFDIDVEVLENASGDAVTFAEEAEEDVFGADVGMIESLGFLGGEREDFLDAGRVRDVADHFLIGSGADLFFDLHADGFEVEAHFLEDVDGDSLAQLDEAEQEVFGSDEIVVEAVGFFACQRQHLLCSRREIAHGFVAHRYVTMQLFVRFVQSG